MDFTFNISTPSKVIDINTSGESAGSFDVTGSITSGSIGFSTSLDGVIFTPIQYYSFTGNALKPNIPAPFAGEERGALDVLTKVTLRITSSPDFQGNIRLAVCTVPDVPA